MARVYGGGGPFAWLWCFLLVDLLTRIYGPWAFFVLFSFFGLLSFVAILSIASQSAVTITQSPPSPPSPPLADVTGILGMNSTTGEIFNSHTHTYSYDAWWVNVIFLAVFMLIFVVPVVNYEPDYKEYDRPAYDENARQTETPQTPQTPQTSQTPQIPRNPRNPPQRPLLPFLSLQPLQPISETVTPEVLAFPEIRS